MTRTLLVPGLDGSPAPHWQHWWSVTDPNAHMVELSNPSTPDPAVWEEELCGMIIRHPGSVLVGHSLGTILIARVLTQFPQLRVRAALLVAPAETNGAKRIGQFGPIPEARLPVPSTLVASRSDPWMGFSRASALGRAWGADIVDLGFAGHINVASGYGPWPRARGLRDELLLREDALFPAIAAHSAPSYRRIGA